jgi:hypothetical protein
VTENNGFWVGWLDLLTPSFAVTLNYNQLYQITINDCLRLAPFLPELRVSSVLLWMAWFRFMNWSLLRMTNVDSHIISHLRMNHLRLSDWNDDCILTEFFSDSITTASINYVSSLYNSVTNRMEITVSNSSLYCVLIRWCGNACWLRSNALVSTSLPVAAETRFSEPLSSNVRFVLLNYSGFQPSCHNIYDNGIHILLLNCLIPLFPQYLDISHIKLTAYLKQIMETNSHTLN